MLWLRSGIGPAVPLERKVAAGGSSLGRDHMFAGAMVEQVKRIANRDRCRPLRGRGQIMDRPARTIRAWDAGGWARIGIAMHGSHTTVVAST